MRILCFICTFLILMSCKESREDRQVAGDAPAVKAADTDAINDCSDYRMILDPTLVLPEDLREWQTKGAVCSAEDGKSIVIDMNKIENQAEWLQINGRSVLFMETMPWLLKAHQIATGHGPDLTTIKDSDYIPVTVNAIIEAAKSNFYKDQYQQYLAFSITGGEVAVQLRSNYADSDGEAYFSIPFLRSLVYSHRLSGTDALNFAKAQDGDKQCIVIKVGKDESAAYYNFSNQPMK